MAVAVQSVSTTTFANVADVVITKPTGLAVGDLMVAQITVQGNSVTTPSGWTLIRSDVNGGAFASFLFYKIAVSADVSASDFTFSMSAGAVIASGAMARITGHSVGNPIWTSNGVAVNNSASPSFANTITPTVASSLIMMFGYGETGTGTASTYAIATDNPTWTEAWDYTTTDGVDYINVAAYAVRTQTTATGNSSFSSTAVAGTDWVGQMIAIAPSKDASVSDTTTITDSIKGNLTNTVSDTTTITDSMSSQSQREWNTDTKSSTTWTNQEKS